MAFSIDRFYQINRRAMIWIIFFLILWLLRDFFGLIFLTFVLAFIAAPLTEFFQSRLRLPRSIAILVVYCFFLLMLALVVTRVVPQVVREAAVMTRNLPQLEEKIVRLKDDMTLKYPALEAAVPGFLTSVLSEGDKGASKNYREEYVRELSALRERLNLNETDYLARDDAPSTDTQRAMQFHEYQVQRDQLLVKTFLSQQLDLARDRAPVLINLVWRASATMLLALLFSFLISMDLARLGRDVQSLASSRVRDFYQQTAQPVVRFAYIVGRAIRAQSMIASANTILTLLGLTLLGIPSLIMLSFIVFFCSFIPVLGVFLSTLPIALVALNFGGPMLALGSIVMVVVIHAIEAYVLNPMIYGQHFKINPVLVLMILVIGHHAFGMWGMILGVPVAYYFIHDVLGVQVWDENRLGGKSAVPVQLSSLPNTNEAPSADSDAARVKNTTPPPPPI